MATPSQPASDRTSPSAQVLIVEDEHDHAEVMADALRKPGHVCTIVHGLEEATEELLHGSFDVIVTDLVMDAADGIFLTHLVGHITKQKLRGVTKPRSQADKISNIGI